MLVFISGGVRSGKSSLGEKLTAFLAGKNRKIYLATARYYDEEIARRIQIHQQNRADKGFLTIDQSSSIGDAEPFLEAQDTVMLDCLGTLLANELFEREQRSGEPGAEDQEVNTGDPISSEVICNKIWDNLQKLYNRAANLIVISNEVFADGIRYEESIEDYIQTLAKLHIKLAEASDVAIECVYNGYQCHKGEIPGWRF